MKKAFIATVGGVIVLVGAIMLVTPGPGLVVIALGLTILATEFHWAKRWLEAVRTRIERQRAKLRRH